MGMRNDMEYVFIRKEALEAAFAKSAFVWRKGDGASVLLEGTSCELV